MQYIFDHGEKINVKKFGAKAYWLNYLMQIGCNVPKSFFIKTLSLSDLKDNEFLDELKNKLNVFFENNMYHVAIRSSSTDEDLFSESKAGHFNTYIGTFSFSQVIESIRKILINSNNITEKPMGIVLQELLVCDFSGVCFSSNPLNYKKSEIVISSVKGSGTKLVSGYQAGDDLILDLQNKALTDEILGSIQIPKNKMDELIKVCKNIEKNLGFPVDLEWGIAEDKLYLFQSRPISSITSKQNGCFKIDDTIKKNVPSNVINNDKVSMRVFAAKQNINVSNAFIFLNNKSKKGDYHYRIPEKSSFCCGYSAVVIYPKDINNKVNRLFIGEKENIDKLLKCYRYGVRSIPKHSNIKEAIKQLFSLASDYWICAVILQEIYDPIYTGMIRKTNQGYLVEVSRGHFVPKGIVESSQYLINNDKVIYRNEVNQTNSFKILEGHIISYKTTDYKENLVSVEDCTVIDTVKYFKAILDTDKIVEFGILKENNAISPFLIDIVSDNEEQLKDNDIEKGIISHGSVTGKLINIELADNNEEFDMHYYDSIEYENNKVTGIIYICDKPSIALLKLLNASNIGFIFRNGSVLCHLALVLREKGIPAIVMDEISLLDVDLEEIYQLDTGLKDMLKRI